MSRRDLLGYLRDLGWRDVETALFAPEPPPRDGLAGAPETAGDGDPLAAADLEAMARSLAGCSPPKALEQFPRTRNSAGMRSGSTTFVWALKTCFSSQLLPATETLGPDDQSVGACTGHATDDGFDRKGTLLAPVLVFRFETDVRNDRVRGFP